MTDRRYLGDIGTRQILVAGGRWHWHTLAVIVAVVVAIGVVMALAIAKVVNGTGSDTGGDTGGDNSSMGNTGFSNGTYWQCP